MRCIVFEVLGVPVLQDHGGAIQWSLGFDAFQRQKKDVVVVLSIELLGSEFTYFTVVICDVLFMPVIQ